VSRRGDSAHPHDGAGAQPTRTLVVWDPLVRVLHWSLVVAVALGWATTFWLGGWHLAVGWTALAIVVVRIAWGFVGPRRARFSSFVRGPRVAARHARRVLAGDEPRHLGHNPLGGWMIVALLLVVVALAFTGWLSFTASTNKSSALRFQCSPNVVHPMPTMATLSRMPWLLMTVASQCLGASPQASSPSRSSCARPAR